MVTNEIKEKPLTDSQKHARHMAHMSNQRMYLAYIHGSIAVSSVAVALKNKFIFMFALYTLVMSSFQYWSYDQSIRDNDKRVNRLFQRWYPLTLVVFAIGMLYLQYMKSNNNTLLN